ncbi:MAG: FHA domain-containing protein, partial [Gemmatimonadota bacterium]|nr:FHA domain-containing protein [Gemmatimonadota bacterium]
MPYLKLKNEGLKVSGEYRSSEVVIGRAATATVVVAGSGADVVSSAHAKLSWVQDRWMLEDLGSTNGTFFSERRLVQGERQELKVGDSFRLGAGGPQFTVEAVRQDAKPAPTVKEALGIGPDDKTVPMDAVEIPRDLEKPGELLGPQATVVLEDPVAKKEITLNGTQFRLGRGKECDVKPSGTEGTSVSRVHAEIALKPDGNVVLRDMGSRNGTFVNRQQLTRPYRLSPGDVIELGPDGPSF